MEILIIRSAPVRLDARDREVCRGLQKLGHTVRSVYYKKCETISSMRAAAQGAELVFPLVNPYPDYRVLRNMEQLGIPFVGNGAQLTKIGFFKDIMKRRLMHAGIPTPSFVPVAFNAVLKKAPWKFPLIVKPSIGQASILIDETSVVHAPAALSSQLAFIHRQTGRAALIEPFIAGREFCVALVYDSDGRKPRVLGAIELLTAGTEHRVLTHTFKHDRRSHEYWNPPPVLWEPNAHPLLKKISATARAAYSALGCYSFATVDIRLSSSGQPLVLEVNTAPDLSCSDSELARIASSAGLAYPQFLNLIIKSALQQSTILKRNPV